MTATAPLASEYLAAANGACSTGRRPGRRTKRTATTSGYGVGLLSQDSVPERDQRGRSVGASLRGVVAAAECVEQVCAVGGHQ